MNWKIKKQDNSGCPYSLSIGTYKWGLKRHALNLNYMYAVPMNSKAKRHEKNLLQGLWFYMRDGKMHQTKTPSLWIGD